MTNSEKSSAVSKAAGFNKPFTESWLQALTLSIQFPVVRQLKPLFDDINNLSRIEVEGDRLEGAQRVWNLAHENGIQATLSWLPTRRVPWNFDADGPLAFEQVAISELQEFSDWTGWLGLSSHTFSLMAAATSDDWARLVRDEAVRQKKSMSASGMPEGANVRIPCLATWANAKWTMRFEKPEWLQIQFEEPFRTERLTLDELIEPLGWMVASANESLVPKSLPKIVQDMVSVKWMECSTALKPFHIQVMEKDRKDYSPWFLRTWGCVWPIVYREQNILRGQADLDVLRSEISQCFQHVPKLTFWAFLFAKLVSSVFLGRGLGICGDFVDPEKAPSR